MINHEIARDRQDRFAPVGGLVGSPEPELRVPAEFVDAVDYGHVDMGARAIGKPRADHTGSVEDFQLPVGDVGGGHGDAAQAIGLTGQGMQHVFVAMAVHHRLHDDATRDPQRVVQMEHVVEG